VASPWRKNHGLTGEQIGALEILAGHPEGCTEALLKARGFTVGLLGKLIRAGLATATPGIVKAGGARTGAGEQRGPARPGRQVLAVLRGHADHIQASPRRRRKNGSPEIIPGSAFTLDVMLEDAATWKEV